MTAVGVESRVVAARESWRTLLLWVMASRLVVFASFVVLGRLGPHGSLGQRFFHGSLRLLGAWDGAWYQRVAAHGYLLIPARRSDPAFFPLFPIAVRWLHSLALSYTTAGALIANIAFVIGVIAFYELGCQVVPESTALRAAIFLAITPMAFIFSMSYPESLFLALGVLALLAASQGRWLTAAGLVALAALTRPEALMLAIPLTAIAWSQRERLDASGRGRAVAAALAAPAALACFPLYLWWSLGDPQAWGKAQLQWGRVFRIDGPLRAVSQLPELLHHHPLFIRDLALLAVYSGLLVVAARAGIKWPWIASGSLILALPLFSGTVESEGRFGLLALPIYWGAGSLRLSHSANAVIRSSCLAALAAGVLTLRWVWP